MFRLNNNHQDESSYSKRELKVEIKAILSFIKLDKVFSWLKSLLIKENTYKTSLLQTEQSEYRYFNPQHKHIKCLKVSEIIVRLSNYKKIVRNRKKNYDLLYSKLRDSKVGQPILSRQEVDTPYVFPFLLNDEADFEYIRKQGIQILRWEEFYPVENTTIESYRTRLIQVPCHQNLSLEQLNYIVSVINKEKIQHAK